MKLKPRKDYEHLIIGKRIARVSVSRWVDDEWGSVESINSIGFDDGSRLVFNSAPTIDQPVATASYYDARPASRKKEV